MSSNPNLVGAHKGYRNKFILCSIMIVFIIMAVALLFQALGAQFISSAKAAPQTLPAGDLSVVGKPSLPAVTIDAIFRRLGSPMSGTGPAVEQASRQTNIDDAFALAVWWTETNDGAAGVGLADRNPGSVRGSVGYPSAYDGYTIYPSYSAAIVYWFNMLKNNYINRGLSTVYAISHPYVGTSSSPLWAGKVVALMLKYRGEAPIVVHGKKVTEPAVYIHTTPTPLANQAQSQAGKTPKHLSNMTQQVNTPSSLPPSIEYLIVFLALLLAVAIVVFSLWLDKRPPIRNNIEADETQDGIMQGEDAQGDITQGEGVPALNASMQNKDAPNTDALISPAKNIDAPNTDTLGVSFPAIPTSQNLTNTPFDAEFLTNTGANFRIRRTILLPSIPAPEVVEPGESPAASSLDRRSTGLLSRYGETHQE